MRTNNDTTALEVENKAATQKEGSNQEELQFSYAELGKFKDRAEKIDIDPEKVTAKKKADLIKLIGVLQELANPELSQKDTLRCLTGVIALFDQVDGVGPDADKVRQHVEKKMRSLIVSSSDEDIKSEAAFILGSDFRDYKRSLLPIWSSRKSILSKAEHPLKPAYPFKKILELYNGLEGGLDTALCDTKYFRDALRKELDGPVALAAFNLLLHINIKRQERESSETSRNIQVEHMSLEEKNDKIEALLKEENSDHVKNEAALMLDNLEKIRKKQDDISRLLDGYCRDGNVALVNSFLKKIVDLDINRPFDGYSPLNRAVEKGKIAVVKILLSHGANVDQLGKGNCGALWGAYKKNHFGIMEVLLSHGANPNQTDNNRSILEDAAFKGRVQYVSLLVKFAVKIPDNLLSNLNREILRAKVKGRKNKNDCEDNYKEIIAELTEYISNNECVTAIEQLGMNNNIDIESLLKENKVADEYDILHHARGRMIKQKDTSSEAWRRGLKVLENHIAKNESIETIEQLAKKGDSDIESLLGKNEVATPDYILNFARQKQEAQKGEPWETAIKLLKYHISKDECNTTVMYLFKEGNGNIKSLLEQNKVADVYDVLHHARICLDKKIKETDSKGASDNDKYQKRFETVVNYVKKYILKMESMAIIQSLLEEEGSDIESLLKQNKVATPSDVLNYARIILDKLTENDIRREAYEKVAEELYDYICEKTLAEVNFDPEAFADAPDELKSDPNFVLDAVPSLFDIFCYVSPTLQNDRDFILRAVNEWRQIFEHVHEKFRDDRDVIMAAVTSKNLDGMEYVDSWMSPLQYVSDKWKEDREIVLAAVNNDGLALECASDTLKNDREIVLAAMNNNSYAFEYASDELKNDPEILAALDIQEATPVANQESVAFDTVERRSEGDTTTHSSNNQRNNQAAEEVYEQVISPTSAISQGEVMPAPRQADKELNKSNGAPKSAEEKARANKAKKKRNKQNRAEMKALHDIIEQGDSSALLRLPNSEEIARKKDTNGNTAFHHAANMLFHECGEGPEGRDKLIKHGMMLHLLLFHNTNNIEDELDVKNNADETPIDIARSSKIKAEILECAADNHWNTLQIFLSKVGVNVNIGNLGPRSFVERLAGEAQENALA